MRNMHDELNFCKYEHPYIVIVRHNQKIRVGTTVNLKFISNYLTFP